ncbi:hypothetical protein PR048_005058 [Dryococelus australis]|uniref:Uncharacterized protein n=1 Tax=Dryococelus australis TaxID=614101 RepID=A0ABQ9I983_9NEOP|nr:hypothetical protein PR048_005058 [Dryococelus australis]
MLEIVRMFVRAQRSLNWYLHLVVSISSEQYVDLRESRQHHNAKYVHRFTCWVQEHNTFERISYLLASLSTGMLADENVNWDNALKFGIAPMKQIESMKLYEVNVKQNSVMAFLGNVTSSVAAPQPAVLPRCVHRED